MKKILLTFISITAFLNAYSQNDSEKKSRKDDPPSFYLGVGSGINGFCGAAGIMAEYKIGPVYLRAGAGLGSWGTKASFGLKFSPPILNGFSYCASFSYNSGLSGFKTQMETSDTTNHAVNKEVTMDLYKAYTVNLTLSKFWMIKNRHQFFIEGGYCLPLNKTPYTTTDGSVLTKNSISIMNRLAPGGPVISLGFLFGF